MPPMPNAVGSMPATRPISGCFRPPSPAAPWPGGTNGVRLAPVTNHAPSTITKTQMATLTITSTPVTRADSRMPSTAINVRTTTISTAPTLTGASSPNSDVGRWSRLPTYPDQPRATTAAPRANSRNRSQPMIQATNSPAVANAYEYALPAVGTDEASSA